MPSDRLGETNRISIRPTTPCELQNEFVVRMSRTPFSAVKGHFPDKRFAELVGG